MPFENENSDAIHDVRLIRHHVRRSLLSNADHEKYLATLQDDADKGEETLTRFARVWNQNPEDGN